MYWTNSCSTLFIQLEKLNLCQIPNIYFSSILKTDLFQGGQGRVDMTVQMVYFFFDAYSYIRCSQTETFYFPQNNTFREDLQIYNQLLGEPKR